MKKRVADILVNCLIENGITDCFSVVGGGAMHLNNAFVLRDEINKVYCHHEQACAMAAEGYAKISGKMSAVCVTSGPGAINAFNGVQGAYVDNTPMIVISGHPRYVTTVAPTGLNLRYRGVQEFNTMGAIEDMTKYSKLLLEPREVRREVYKAIKIAMTGRRGPVWLEIPLDVQSTLIDEEDLYSIELDNNITEEKKSFKDVSQSLLHELKEAKRPCILTGSGIRVSGSIEKFRKFASKLGVPVVGGALQADIMHNDNSLYYGMSGNVGPRCGNFILQNADLIIAIGNSLSFKQTGFKQDSFATKAKLIMLDIEEDEAKKPGLKIDKFYNVDLAKFFDEAIEYVEKIDVASEWIKYCDELKKSFSFCEALGHIDRETEGVSAAEYWKGLLELTGEESIFALGNSSCVVPPLVFGINKENQRVVVNYNSGSMGDDLPEAVGVAIATGKEVYCVTGDGSIMMNLQELQTIKYNKLPIKIVIFSNNGYAAIRRTCKNFFKGMYTGCDSDSGINMPDFEKIAYGFDIAYKKCKNAEEIEDSIHWMNEQDGVCIVEVMQKIEDTMYPRLMSKMKEDGTFLDPELHDMYPFISDEEMTKWMPDWE